MGIGASTVGESSPPQALAFLYPWARLVAEKAGGYDRPGVQHLRLRAVHGLIHAFTCARSPKRSRSGQEGRDDSWCG